MKHSAHYSTYLQTLGLGTCAALWSTTENNGSELDNNRVRGDRV
jgi:hypothetical protein